VSPATFWLAVAGGMAVTFATRASFFFLPQADRMPATFRRGLRFVPPAVLSAILVTMISDPVAEDGLAAAWPQLAAIAVAAIAGWQTRNTWITIGLGMVALWALQALAG
jgi:branched-subunit amino acid transport protein